MVESGLGTDRLRTKLRAAPGDHTADLSAGGREGGDSGPAQEHDRRRIPDHRQPLPSSKNLLPDDRAEDRELVGRGKSVRVPGHFHEGNGHGY